MTATESYNIAVQSKFGLFMEEDIEDAEADVLLEKAKEEKKQREEQQRKEKEAARKEQLIQQKKALKEAKKAKAQPAANDNTAVARGDAQQPRGRGARGGRGGQFANVGPRLRNQQNDENAPAEFIPRENSGPPRGASRGARGGRGAMRGAPRGGLAGAQGGFRGDENGVGVQPAPAQTVRGREFDRHSGSNKSGVKPMDKRSGTGAYNWGNIQDEMRVDDDVPTDGLAPATKATDGASPLKDGATGEAVAPAEGADPDMPAVAPVKQMTLEQWKAQRVGCVVSAEAAAASTSAAAASDAADTAAPKDDKKTKGGKKSASASDRKANDGQNVFSGMSAYKKAPAQPVHAGPDASEDEELAALIAAEQEERAQRNVPVRIRFAGAPGTNAGGPGQRGGRGGAGGPPGGRGGPTAGNVGGPVRGGRGGGAVAGAGGMPPSSRQKDIDVSDVGEFPSLGGAK